MRSFMDEMTFARGTTGMEVRMELVGNDDEFKAQLAAEHGLRAPFLLGAVIASAGLLLSLLTVRETRAHARAEASFADAAAAAPPPASAASPGLFVGEREARNVAMASQSHCGISAPSCAAMRLMVARQAPRLLLAFNDLLAS